MTPAVLGVSTYTTPQTQAFIRFIVVAKVTTVHLNLEYSRSFDRPINTRIPEHPALHDIIDLCLFLIAFHFFVYSVLLGYEPEGSPSQYYFFLSFDQVAIRTLGTLPRTWASLRGTHWTEHHKIFAECPSRTEMVTPLEILSDVHPWTKILATPLLLSLPILSGHATPMRAH